MSELSVIIVDDEKAALEVLSEYLYDTGEVKDITKLTDPRKLEAAISKCKPDVIFLDVEMPGYDGIEVLKNLREYRPCIPVVYVTAHKEFAYKAAKNNPFSYLLKPVNPKELYEVLKRLKNYIANFKSEDAIPGTKIKLPVKDGIIYINFKDVITLTAQGNYTKIQLVDGESYMSSYNLGKLHDKYFVDFLRINRQTIVNGQYLKEINKKNKFCILKTDTVEIKPEISTTFLRHFNKKL